MDLSNERVILTYAPLDPAALPGDGFYLQVVACIRRTVLEQTPTYLLITPDPYEEFTPLPFDDPEWDSDTGDEVHNAQENEHGVSLFDLEQRSLERQAGTAAAEANVISVDEDTPEEEGAEEEGGDAALWNMICPASLEHLQKHPSDVAGAKEVYIVRVPYRVRPHDDCMPLVWDL
ncbi:uncharacterized protein B0H18DRAFT_1116108 [Fomitopsis serialis]|uniref:uncharacterized protein n=1 Tax=Fomitopsis serialis TaxID=139415 RepID=UPI002007CE33|nr:uncharacterized protein B0H18DRAFT_1116108 [Neoantrodia serialis]KAH9931853.1 hypothetical protein B0H18DRAFT_1116108 [Neoantrodia serialis]